MQQDDVHKALHQTLAVHGRDGTNEPKQEKNVQWAQVVWMWYE
jgi:hypothetical protein